MVTLMAKKKVPPHQEEGQELDPVSAGSIRIRPDIAYKLRIVCEADKTTAAKFLDPLIRGAIELAFKRVSKKLSDLAEQQPG